MTLLANVQIPSLQKVNGKTCLMADGKPFVMYSGELHNSTASSLDYMDQQHVFEKLAAMKLNSVIATISWEQFEPADGKMAKLLLIEMKSAYLKNSYVILVA